jgi:hypothetical protein
MFSALAFGLAPFVWGQALVTEVYALHGLLMAACLSVLSVEKLKGNEWTRGFIFGVAAANHLTSVLMFPLILLNFKQGLFVSRRIFLIRCLGILSGLSLYLLLPLRAYFDPPVNWGNAATPEGFFWLISGQLYSNYMFGLSFVDIVQRFRAFAGLLMEQYTLIGALLGIYGLFSLPSRSLRLASIWMAVTFLSFSIFYGSADSQVNLLPVWLVFAIWLAFGLQDLFGWLHAHSRIQVVIAGLIIAALIIRIPFSLRDVDVSGDFRTRDFIDQAFNEIPKDSLVFLDGDQQIFSLWYAQFALHRRTDIVLVASSLLPYEWYLESLKQTYPDLNIPERDAHELRNLVTVNPNQVVCYISADKPIICVQPASQLEKAFNWEADWQNSGIRSRLRV